MLARILQSMEADKAGRRDEKEAWEAEQRAERKAREAEKVAQELHWVVPFSLAAVSDCEHGAICSLLDGGPAKRDRSFQCGRQTRGNCCASIPTSPAAKMAMRNEGHQTQSESEKPPLPLKEWHQRLLRPEGRVTGKTTRTSLAKS
eukprot:gene9944-6947_t